MSHGWKCISDVSQCGDEAIVIFLSSMESLSEDFFILVWYIAIIDVPKEDKVISPTSEEY